MANEQNSRSKVIKMLLALEGQIRDAAAMARMIERGIQSENFTTFLKFRAKVDEMMSFSAIIERRIEEISDINTEALSRQFLKLNILALTMLVRSNKTFFQSLSSRRAVPMGARDVLDSELKFLDTLREQLSQPHYLDKVDQSIFEGLDDIETAIRAVSDRTTTLDDFSSAPSLAEWTGQARVVPTNIATNKVRKAG